MSLEDIEIKNPEALTKEMGEAVFNQLFEGEPAGEPKPDSAAQLSDDEQLEDIPNASIRLDKLKKQRDEERSRAQDLERRLAQMEGKLSVLDKGDSQDDEVDPTEYMDDTQKFLFNENQQLKDNISKLTDAVQGMQNEGSKKKLEDQESRFFENNPELNKNRDEFVEDMLSYLKDKPSIKSMLKAGEVSLAEVHGMYSASKPKSVKNSQVSNPDKVFSGHSGSLPASKNSNSESQAVRRKAINILNNRDSTNKKEATDFLQKEITEDIISQLDI